MPSDTPMPRISRLDVIETGSRRRWTLEEKQRIVAESFSGPRLVSATARRHGLSNSQLFNWRRLARSGQLVSEDETAGFAPAIVMPKIPQSTASGSPDTLAPAGEHALAAGRIVIVLACGRRVMVGSDVDAAALRRVLDVMDGGAVRRSLGKGR